jgi:uncharacterized membrane protein YGL010W
MLNPLVKYKAYHRDKTNINIHQVCVPILLMSIYSVFPVYISFSVNVFYSMTYLLFDVLSTKSIHSVYYLQSLFLLHFLFRQFLSFQYNIYIHIISWVLQIIGHKLFENNAPAFLDNLYDSFLFAPYFTFLETFYPSSFEPKNKYTIIKNEYDTTKKSIIYFAGLFQKAQIEYKDISNELTSYNHIYINTNFDNNDIYKDTLIKIIDELGEIDIECIVGFSFGGSLSLQFKEIYFEKINKKIENNSDQPSLVIPTILISPGGFKSNTFMENTIKVVSKYLYSLYCNDKWYMIQNYPIYQNTNTLSNTDYIIVSTSDTIHNPQPIKTHQNSIVLKHASHLSMIKIIKKQNIISQLIKNDYQIDKVIVKPLTSNLNKLLFGGHFFPYHISFWIIYTIYHVYKYIHIYNTNEIFAGFILISALWSFTEYMFHRFLLHNILYKHHKKHHIYPNKLSIIHTPMSMVLLNKLFYVFLFYNFKYYLYMFQMFIGVNYLSFEIIHLLSHSYKGSNNIIINAKHFHKLHHIDENVNYSFITSFWDYIFGTLSSKYKVSFLELLFGFIPFYSFFIHKKTEL